MAKKTYTYEATIKIKVRVEEVDGAGVALLIARDAMLSVREVECDGLYGSAKVSCGTPRRIKPTKSL